MTHGRTHGPWSRSVDRSPRTHPLKSIDELTGRIMDQSTDRRSVETLRTPKNPSSEVDQWTDRMDHGSVDGSSISPVDDFNRF
uniref:Uncharacterized protein n=1 Tax=Solanum tuberosum TaxID=4113 RepID=M1DGS3_SOLTU